MSDKEKSDVSNYSAEEKSKMMKELSMLITSYRHLSDKAQTGFRV